MKRALSTKRGFFARRAEESGAVAIMTAISLVFLIGAGALSVDIGHVIFTEKKLQKVVDLAALETVAVLERALNSPTGFGSGVDPQTRLTEVAKAAVDRNGIAPEDALHANDFTVEVGVSDKTTKTFTPIPFASWQLANAVRINGGTTQDYSFYPGGAPLTEAAIGRLNLAPDNDCTVSCTPCIAGSADCPKELTKFQAWAQISVGSTLGNFSSRDSFMDPFMSALFGTTVDLDAAGYDGLAAADVSLEELFTSLEVDAGDSDEVLNSTVSLRDLVTASATALNSSGDPASIAAATALNTFAASVSNGATFTFNDVIDFGMSNPGAVAKGRVNVLDLLTVAAEASNGSNLLTVDLPFTIPGVSSARLTIALIEKPKVAAGPPGLDSNGVYFTVAQTAQARVYLEANLSNTVVVAGQVMALRLPIYIDAAKASTSLTGVTCDTLKSNTVTKVTTSTGAVNISLADVNTAQMFGPTVTKLPGAIGSVAGLVTVTGSGSMTIAGSTKSSTFTGAHEDATGNFLRKDHIGATDVQLDSLRDTSTYTASALGLGLSPALIAAQVKAAVAPAYDQLEASVLNPLLQTPFGITLGGADIVNMDTRCTYTTTYAN